MPVLNEATDYNDEYGNSIIGQATSKGRLTIFFGAKNCRIEIEEGVILKDVNITMQADGGTVILRRDTELRGRVRTGLNSTIVVGSRLTPTGSMNISAAEGTSVTIGNDCMFAVDIDIRSDDAHPIFSRSTGQRLNQSRSVTIGNHVWLGPHVAVLSGASIGNGSVIGYRSVVKGVIPEHSIAVGIPAKVTKSDIVWDKLHLSVQQPWSFDTSEGLNLWSNDA